MWKRRGFLEFGLIGMNFKTAGLSLREEMSRALGRLSKQDRFQSEYAVISLSTCNRNELYFSSSCLKKAKLDLFAFLKTQIQEPFEEYTYFYFGLDAFIHLCRVASGLDSAVLAETEIQRQVKIAYQKTAESVYLPESIHYVFQKALKVSKEVRTRTDLKGGNAALFYALLEISRQSFADLNTKKILFVGYSEINRKFASFLRNEGIKNLTLATRSLHAVNWLNEQVYSRDLLTGWQEYDLILAATHCDQFLIEGKGKGSHLIFDLSVPRNVDPLIQGACLMNIEQITHWIRMQNSLTMKSIHLAEHFVQERAKVLTDLYWKKVVKKYVLSKVSMSRETRKWNHITDIFHAGDEKNQSFKPDAETRVRNSSVFAKI